MSIRAAHRIAALLGKIIYNKGVCKRSYRLLSWLQSFDRLLVIKKFTIRFVDMIEVIASGYGVA